MAGGLMNLVAVGNQNVFLTGNPKKSFFKFVYSKYSNFGLQKFRLDFEGSKFINATDKTHLEFKVQRYADLLVDTFLVIKLPTIWSSIYYNETLEQFIPYSFKWIEHLGTQIIAELTITCGGTLIQKVDGQYLTALVQRDFSSTKKELYNEMTGNTSQFNDPGKYVYDNKGNSTLTFPLQNLSTSGSANWFNTSGHYPHVIRDNGDPIQQPSIVGQNLYIPLNIWYTLSSKMAFPLVALQYNEIYINITLRPLREWFTINNVTATTESEIKQIQPNFNDEFQQFYRFIQPTPEYSTPLPITETDDDYTGQLIYTDKRTSWDSDPHLICTYGFLEKEERREFAAKEINYLIKNIYRYDFHNLFETNRIEMDALGMVASWVFFYRRSDAYKRNQWTNYTNWEYKNDPFTAATYNNIKFLNRIGSIPPLYDKFYFTGALNTNYEKIILRTLGFLLNGQYRENILHEGVYNYCEKYLKTGGHGPDGLYCYNFCLDTNPFILQPNGAMNLSKFKEIEMEFNIRTPPLDSEVSILTVCDPEGNLPIGTNKLGNGIYKYTYDLYVYEERFNMLTFSGGNCGLLYAR